MPIFNFHKTLLFNFLPELWVEPFFSTKVTTLLYNVHWCNLLPQKLFFFLVFLLFLSLYVNTDTAGSFPITSGDKRQSEAI